MISELTRRATIDEGRLFLRAARAPRLRTMREFAEQELRLPDGPFKGLRFRCDRQPFTRVFLDLVDTLKWNRIATTGGSQSGKTWIATIVPTLYHLFEMKETVIFGIPSMEMAADKWHLDLLPAIKASKFADLLPRNGSGSKGGKIESIQFQNGATLKFMSGGGDDKKRSAFTSRVVVITEVDGMDEAGETSREADKISQIEARTMAFGDRKRIYLECTVSIKEGRIWQEYSKGTATRIFLPCVKCGEFVHPTRDSLQGWADAADEVEAKANAAVFCPQCGEAWSDDELAVANRAAVAVHRGQEIACDGTISGPVPQTDTLGFRWDAINNRFLSPGFVAAEEWKAQRAEDEENAEKKLRQFFWAIPYEPGALDTTPLEYTAIMARTKPKHLRGVIPENSDYITVGVDVGKRLLYWTAIAWRRNGDGHVLDYGRQEVASDQLGEKRAIMIALRELRDNTLRDGWQLGDERVPANTHWIDSGYQTDVIYEFCRESGAAYLPVDGLGTAHELKKYTKPKTTGTTVRKIGEGYHIAVIPARRALVAEVHADHWKSRVHEGLATPIGQPGAITLYQPERDPNEHLSFAKQLTAEKRKEEFEQGKGMTVTWVRERRENHWLDSTYYAAAAGAFCGVKLIKAELPDAPPPRQEAPVAPQRIRDMRFRR